MCPGEVSEPSDGRADRCHEYHTMATSSSNVVQYPLLIPFMNRPTKVKVRHIHVFD